MEKIFYQSSLPRAGSTLLQNILAQNPDIYATPTSGVLELIFGARANYTTSAEFKAQDAETMKTGCFMISDKGRPSELPLTLTSTGGNFTKCISTMPNTATTVNATYAPIKGVSNQDLLWEAKLGPTIAPIKPPAMTQDTAFSLNDASANSAAANR